MALEFRAPWSASLKTASSIAVVLLLGIAVTGIWLLPARAPLLRTFMAVLPAGIAALALLFMVSSYKLTVTMLEIRRPFWTTTIELSDLVAVAGDAEALRGALRVFGNGGLFSFTGVFWKRGIGLFHAYATDPGRAVVLKFKKRTVIITPDDPLRFIVRVRTDLASRAQP
ncbi:MAG TPA: PH domain-containing protein [Steroidobacteraceae bacterium]